MSEEIQLSCKCGGVRGRLRDATPKNVMRVVCYCADCQAFAHHLGRADLLDEHGGSDIVQVAPNTVSYLDGVDRIAAVRLGPKGPYRWYARCCKTPLGNTLKPNIPFIGFVHEVFKGNIDVFGPPSGKIWGKSAVGKPPSDVVEKVPFGLIASSFAKILGWKFGGGAWPHPYFERGRDEPRFPVTTLTLEERNALKTRCGPGGTISATLSA